MPSVPRRRLVPIDRRRAPLDTGSVQTGAIILFTLNVVVCVAVFFAGDLNLGTSAVLVAAFGVFSVFFSMIFSESRPRPSALSASVYLGYGLILPAIYQCRTGYFPWNAGFVEQSALLPAAILTFVSVSIFVAGALYRGPSPARLASPQSNDGAATQGITSRGSNPALLICLSVLAFCLVSYFAFGGDVYRSTRAAVSGAALDAGLDQTSLGLLIILPRGLAIGSLALAGFLFATRPRSYLTITTLSIAILSNFLVNFPTSLPRFMLMALIFTLILTIFRPIFYRLYRYLFFIIPISLYAIFPILGSYNRGLELDLGSTHPGLEYLESGDFDGFQSTVNAVSYVSDEGLMFGRVLLSAGLFFVPRSIWAGKLEPSGSFVAENAGYSFLNISMPLYAELYLDGWFLLAIVGMFFVGRLSKISDQHYDTHIADRPLLAMIAILLCGYFPILLRGSLLGIISAIAASAGVVILWSLLASLGRRPTHRRRSKIHPHRLSS